MIIIMKKEFSKISVSFTQPLTACTYAMPNYNQRTEIPTHTQRYY